jgi:AcrR family transcriptional regulator
MSSELAEVDGRRARRFHNREAVVDAMLSLYAEGELAPTVAQVAARAGLSDRSLFRYFADAEELYRVAVDRHLQSTQERIPVPGPRPSTTHQRITRFVNHRLDLYETNAPIARAGRLHAGRSEVLAASLDQNRQRMRADAFAYFAEDLARLSSDEQQLVRPQLALAGTFEVLEALRVQQGLSTAEARRTLTHTLSLLLGLDAASSPTDSNPRERPRT